MLRSEYRLNLASWRFNTRYPYKPDTPEYSKRHDNNRRAFREINKKLTSQETVAYRLEHDIQQASIPSNKLTQWELQVELYHTSPFQFVAICHQPPEDSFGWFHSGEFIHGFHPESPEFLVYESPTWDLFTPDKLADSLKVDLDYYNELAPLTEREIREIYIRTCLTYKHTINVFL